MVMRTPRLSAVTPAWAGLKQAMARLRAWLREDDGSWHEGAPRPFLLFLLIFGVGIVTISLLGDQGLLAYHGLRKEESALRAEIERLERQEGDLASRIQALHGDPQYIEMLARQRLGLVKPGETVLQLPRQQSP
jgi:cell division protein FtsB